MKSTWPTPAPHVGDPTRPIFHLLAFGVCIEGNAHFRVRVGGNAILSFLNTNMLVSPTQNSKGVSPNATAKGKCFRIAVEYRLNGVINYNCINFELVHFTHFAHKIRVLPIHSYRCLEALPSQAHFNAWRQSPKKHAVCL